MKKTLYTTASLLFVIGIIIFSCKKKTSTGVSPGYGNSKNPTTTGQTVTGNTTYTNPATENTSVFIGSGFRFKKCSETNSLSIITDKEISLQISVQFNTTIAKSGTFAVASIPSDQACAVTVLNAPNQPEGVLWYGQKGEVVVTVDASGIKANLKDVVCTQKTFNFPQVLVSGLTSCTP